MIDGEDDLDMDDFTCNEVKETSKKLREVSQREEVQKNESPQLMTPNNIDCDTVQQRKTRRTNNSNKSQTEEKMNHAMDGKYYILISS